MAQGFVQLPTDAGNTGKKEDHWVTATNGQYREGVVIADPSTDAAVATVTAANGLQVDVTRVQGNVATTVADGANVNQGANADAAVTGDNTGTVSAKLRGLSKIWADVWDSVNHWLKVNIQNATLAVTQSGNWSTRTQDGSGNAITSTGAALDVNLKTSSITVPVSQAPVTSGGLALPTHIVTTGANNEKANIKASAGQVYRVSVYNGETFPIFVKLHNTAVVPTPGTGVVLTLGVQAGTSRDFSADALGIAFGTGIGITVTKLVADADTTQVGTNSVIDVYSK